MHLQLTIGLAPNPKCIHVNKLYLPSPSAPAYMIASQSPAQIEPTGTPVHTQICDFNSSLCVL